MAERAIYEFPLFKKALKNLGYRIEKAQAYKAISPIDVSIKDLNNGNLEITSDGIFFVTSDGTKYQGFMYKREYHLSKFGKPRFHIYDCETIKKFQSSGNFYLYRWSNSEIVSVIDMDDLYIEKQIENIPLCNNCRNILLQKQNQTYLNSHDFVKVLKNVVSSKETNIDIFGYVRDWEDISRSYREKMNYTCERCGIHIESPFFQHEYMHCHHKNGNKTDNRDENLECLCIDCHSKTDSYHMERFSKGQNKIMLDDFRKKYRE